MELSVFTIILNSVLLVGAFAITAFLLQAGARYAYHYGDTPKQDVLRWRILKLILLLVVIGLVASAYNIALPYFE